MDTGIRGVRDGAPFDAHGRTPHVKMWGVKCGAVVKAFLVRLATAKTTVGSSREFVRSVKQGESTLPCAGLSTKFFQAVLLTLDETRRLFYRITDRRDMTTFLTAYHHWLRAKELD